MRRFWDTAAIAPLPEGGFAVLLDGRPVRLPGGAPRRVAHRRLAVALAAVWNAAGGGKGGEAGLEALPLTRLVGTAQERIAPDPAPTVAAIAKYAETDLLCYRAEERRLAERQAAEWQPLLDWAALQLDAPLRVTSGVMPVAQDPSALAALRRAVAARTPLELAALGVAVPALGSVVLGLALALGRLDAAEAFRLATLDEAFQEAFWGVDAEAAARRARIAAEVALARRLMDLASSE
ncbi:ATP12 family protein [Caldovatus aquaticus]|uniref:Chaperone, ATP12 n=1 Tax=Caldovatus aquaticus TaxID=2865671 RepID=A0ABS7F4C5_9PROT|nr:ATP12 family protein [Caldovatus aquaticus]MBW8269797.1 chaperone, ATP12 [Caldovatus aquaticus]